MYTVKVTYTTHGDNVTDLIECDTPRITRARNGVVSVFIIGGRFDSWVFTTGVEMNCQSNVASVYEIIIENSHGKTTEVFRAAGSIGEWRDKVKKLREALDTQ